MTRWVKWCLDCLRELKKPRYPEGHPKYDPYKDDYEFHELCRTVTRDADDPNYKKLKRAVRKYENKVLKLLKDGQGLMKIAYGKPATKEDLPGFFSEENIL